LENPDFITTFAPGVSSKNNSPKKISPNLFGYTIKNR